MTIAEVVASTGVLLLLVAFAANLRGALGRESALYQGLNFVGAGMACFASFLIAFLPFVILEGAWALVALVTLVRSRQHRRGYLPRTGHRDVARAA